MKWVFLGDSLTWGGYGGRYLDEVARRLPACTLINAGVGGDTVLNLLERLDAALAVQPDGVFVMIGGNDAIAYSQPATRPYYAQSKGVPDGAMTPQQFARTYRDLLERLALAHVPTWVGLPPIEYNPATVAALRDYNRLAAQAARVLNLPALDLMAAFPSTHVPERPPLNLGTITLIGRRIAAGWQDYETERARGGYTFTFDGLHFTPEAARRAGALVASFIAPTHPAT